MGNGWVNFTYQCRHKGKLLDETDIVPETFSIRRAAEWAVHQSKFAGNKEGTVWILSLCDYTVSLKDMNQETLHGLLSCSPKLYLDGCEVWRPLRTYLAGP